MLSSIFNIFRIVVILISSGTIWSALKVSYSNEVSNNYKQNKQGLAINLTKALQQMGPSFIKLGQFLSTRPDLLGEEMAESLTMLQDKLPPFPAKQVLRILEEELGRPISHLYKEVNMTPVAAASIAQVHRAVTLEGEEVAVKVLRPNIDKLLHRDLNLLSSLARVFSFIYPSLLRLQLDQAVETLSKSIQIELDLRLEAAAADQLRANLADDHSIYIPSVHWSLTSQKVFTMEWIEGVPISNKERLLQTGINLKELAHNLALSFFNQALRDGFFHADMHPGNILVMKDGRVALVDFGIMGHLDRKSKIFIAQMLHSFIKRDYKKVADLHFTIGYIPADQSLEQFALACRSIGEPIIGLKTNQISIGLLMKQLFSISHNFQMVMQPQLILLQKTMVTIEGLGVSLYPEVNMWELVEPWISKWAEKNFSIRAKAVYSYHNSLDAFKQINELVRTVVSTNKPVDNLKTSNSYSYLYFAAGVIFATVLYNWS